MRNLQQLVSSSGGKALKVSRFMILLLYSFVFFYPFYFQKVETGAHGTSGVYALRHVIQVGSAAFGCVKAQESRITPAMAQGRKCAPATTRSAQVCVCGFFSSRSNMHPLLILHFCNQDAFHHSSFPPLAPFSMGICLFLLLPPLHLTRFFSSLPSLHALYLSVSCFFLPVYLCTCRYLSLSFHLTV